MEKQPENNSTPPGGDDELKNILDRLTEQEKVLILCTRELYGGRWDLILKDLTDRLEGRPYVLTLGQRIRDDIDRVRRLQTIEQEHAIKLSDYVTI